MGINLYPWQRTAARYLTALGQGDRWLYRHVAIVVARQNGKTKLLPPLIVSRLLAGHRIMHTAQDRNLPREIFSEVADFMAAEHVGDLAVRNGRIVMPRFANGQEEIRMRNGGIYSIVAPTRSGARGPSRDLVIIDELREMDDHDFIAAANPTLQASKHPQMLYLSNAGDETSVVLNGIRASRDDDPSLAYLEWSADESVPADDVMGWLQSNPSIGHNPDTFENLAADYKTLMSRGELPIFETENLCRWVATLRERLIDDFDWMRCKADGLGTPIRPAIAVSLDPDGSRASVAMAWQAGDEIALTLLADQTGEPVDIDAIGTLVKEKSSKHGAEVGYDPLTDAELVKYVKKGKAVSITGQKYAAASSQFVNGVNSTRIRWADCDPITDDLTWTARKPDGNEGSYHAVRAKDDRPIPAALAAIRAVWLVSGPQRSAPKVY